MESGNRIKGHTANRQVGRLDSLTSLRFFAALMVFMWHVTPYIGISFFYNLEFGYAGVGFFYILSGFILTYVYFDKLRNANAHSIKSFYSSRIAKLVPLHWLTFLCSLPLVLPMLNAVFPDNTKIKTLGAAITNLGLVQAWFPQSSIHFSFNGVAWSISVEVFFYVLFPFIILFVSKYLYSLSAQKIVLSMIVTWLTVVFIFLPKQVSLDDWSLYIFPPARLVDFIMGILLGMAYIKTSAGSGIMLFSTVQKSTIIEVLSIVLLVAGFSLSLLMPQSLRFSLWLMPFWLIIIFVFAQERGYISKILLKRPLVFLGEASFSFYMIHQLAIRYVAGIGLTGGATIILSLVFAVLLSAVSYVLYEEPLRLRLKTYLEHITLLKITHRSLIPIKEEISAED